MLYEIGEYCKANEAAGLAYFDDDWREICKGVSKGNVHQQSVKAVGECNAYAGMTVDMNMSALEIVSR